MTDQERNDLLRKMVNAEINRGAFLTSIELTYLANLADEVQDLCGT